MAKNDTQYPLDGFPYGLNTAIDESILSPKYSPRMLNVFISDTNSVIRRSGVSSVVATVSAGKEVRAMHKLYRKDGSQHMMYVCGTHLYKQAVSATPSVEYDFQFLTTTCTATYGANVSSNSFANGNALTTTQGVVIAQFPACTSLYCVIPSTASYKWNGSAWQNHTGGTLNLTASKSGVNTLNLKAADCNTTALRIAKNHACSMNRTVSGSVDNASISFYDNGDTGSTAAMIISVNGNGLSMSGGIYGLTSTTHYVFNYTSISGISRTTGWHEIRLVQSGTKVNFYFDGVGWGSQTGTLAGAVLAITTNADYTSAVAAYADRYCENYKVVDDFDNTSQWTLVTGSGHSAVTGTYVNVPRSLVADYAKYTINYSLTPSDVEKVTATVAGNTYGFVTAENFAYFGNRHRVIKRFDGSSTYTVATTPNPQAGFMVENKGRVFVSGGDLDRTLIYFSAAGKPLDFSTAGGGGVMRVTATVGDAVCTGLAVHSGKVLYFSDSRVAAIDTSGAASTDWTSGAISTSHGCIAPKSLVSGDRGVLFLSADGVRGYGPLQSMFANDGSGFSYLSKNIRGLNIIKSVGSAPTGYEFYNPLTGYSEDDRKDAVGAFYDGKYWLFIGNDCYIADLLRKTDNDQPIWTFHQFAGLDSASTRVSCAYVTRGDEYKLLVGTKNGYVYRMDYSQTDVGDANIHWEYSTPPIAVGGYMNEKHFKNIHMGAAINIPYVRSDILASSTRNFTLTTETDESHRSFPPQQVAATVNTDIRPNRIRMSSSGRALRIKVSGTTQGEEFPIDIPYMVLNYGKPRAR